MTAHIELAGDITRVGEQIVLTFPDELGSIAVRAYDCQVTDLGIAVAVGTMAELKGAPPCKQTPDLSPYSELIERETTSYACFGAQPWINLPGAFIDCTTGKVLGKCYQSFPCTAMK